MNSVEFTLREILISVVIILVMLGLGFFISGSIYDKETSENEKYFKALKIDNDPNLFDYGIRTEVGGILAYGEFKANQPVSDPLIKGQYFSINKMEEHYTMHTRTVTYSCGKSTCTRIETYWTWDVVDSWINHTKTFNYLGRDFKYAKIDFDNYEFCTTVNVSSDVRFVFNVIPKHFNGSLYSTAKDKTISNTEIYTGQKIKEIINNKEHSADTVVTWFWASWIFLILIIIVVFGILENKYINNERGRY